MADKFPTASLRHSGNKALKLAKTPTKIDKLYSNKDDYKRQLGEFREEIHELQGQLYAQNQQSVLVIFQAMDAAGKDSTIEHVFNGVDPQGVEVTSFKRPSSLELDHDFLWRTIIALPPRGKIGVHNRSHYEEVLICRVHPDIITKYQRLPKPLTADMKLLFKQRHESIRDFEKHLSRNGTKVIKFYLHVSREEQRKRLLARIEEPGKNWKFEAGDLEERNFWKDYAAAYEETIPETATPESPWYVIPADDKRNMRLLVARVLRDEMKALKLAWPVIDDAQRAVLQKCREILVAEQNA